MPEYRKLHNNFDMGERTDQLTDFELRVWLVYRACADDFGVCPMLPGLLKGRSRRLSRQSDKAVMKAMRQLVTVELCQTFNHQGLEYLCQGDWQEREDIRHPRTSTSHPAPSPEVFGNLSEITQELFRQFHPKCRASARVRVRETHTLTKTLSQTQEGGSGETMPNAVPSVPVPRGPALIESPLAWDRKHGAVHVTEFCDWVCFPNELHTEFAHKVPSVTHEAAKAQVLEWARDIRRQWQARIVPDGSPWDFWKHRWTETHGSSRPTSGPKGDGLDALRTVVRHG